MAEFLKKTVKPSGGDYTSLEACMNANEQDLTGDGWFTVEIDGTWSSADTSAVMIQNYTTTASDYINIYTTAAARHDGKWDTGAYNISVNTIVLNFSVLYLTIDGLQLRDTSGGGGERVLDESIDSGTCLINIKNNIIRASNASSTGIGIYCHGDAAGVINIFNNLVYSSPTASIGMRTGGASGYTFNIYNNVVVGFGTGISQTNSSTVKCTNNYVSSTTCYSGTITLLTTASSDTTGSVGLRSIAYSTSSGAYFTNVTAGSEDFHLVAGSSLRRAGTDLSATFYDDIMGQWRGSTWSIGVDEIETFWVKPSGGDYTALETCMNAQESDLTPKGFMNVEIDGTWSSADTSAVTIHNYTTTSVDYINIYTTATARHLGVFSSDYYRVVASDDTDAVIFILVSNITITGIQASNTYSGANSVAYAFGTDGNNNRANIVIDKCFGKAAGSATRAIMANYTDQVLIKNSIFIANSSVTGVYLYSDTLNEQAIYNSIGINYGAGVAIGGYHANAIAKNCFGYSVSGNDLSSVITKTTCAAVDATGNVQVVYDTTTFVNVTQGSEDFHLVVGSALINAGTDLSATFTDDIDGQTRPTGASTWDIGADEYILVQSFYKGTFATLPSDDSITDFTEFSATEYTNVLTNDDTTYTNQAGTGAEYVVMLFREIAETQLPITISWNGQSDVAPSSKPVYLQVCNRNFFPTTGLLDDFNRANVGPPPSASWTTYGTSGLLVDTQQVALSGVGVERGAYWNASTFGPNIEVYVTCPTVDANTDVEIGFVDSTSWTELVSFNVMATSSDMYVREVVVDNVSTVLADGDSYGLSLIGDRVSLYRKRSGVWTVLMSYDGFDNIAGRTGYLFLSMYDVCPAVDDFGGGNVVGDGWETLASNNVANADTDFSLTGSISADIADYYDTDNCVSARIYQQVG